MNPFLCPVQKTVDVDYCYEYETRAERTSQQMQMKA